MRRIAILTTTMILAASLAYAQSKPPLKPKSKAEATAVQAMLSAQDPDARIKAAEDLITKFADTPYKGIALEAEAEAYSQKGDVEKAIVFGEQSLDADPDTYQAAVLLTRLYATTVHVNDLDKADKIAKIQKYGKIAIDEVNAAAKPNPQITDEQWNGYKKDFLGQTYFGLGIAATYTGKFDEAKEDFDKVATMDADPTDLIRAARALLDVKKYADAVALYEKVDATNAPANIKQIASSEKARAQSMIKK